LSIQTVFTGSKIRLEEMAGRDTLIGVMWIRSLAILLLGLVMQAAQAGTFLSFNPDTCAATNQVECGCCDCGGVCPCTVRDTREEPPLPFGVPVEGAQKLNFIPAICRSTLDSEVAKSRERGGSRCFHTMQVGFFEGVRMTVSFCSLVI
jgi:hypothetical protein